MFERTLESLIKGLRSHRGSDEVAYVSKLSEEIRHELKSGDMEVKAGAVLKLTYLQMLGYSPASYSSFPILEVMASSHYHLKQVGYLAASQSFNQGTDVLILATNLVKKDLHSANPLEVAVALNGLSHIVTPDLAQHLCGDIIGMMNHSRPAIRKRAVLVLYSIIQKYPEALDQSWHRLQEKLEDSDQGVVSATVNIICELGRRDPKRFLPFSPQLFELLTSSSNNWMLIKIVKLFGALSPHEPRLVRKLLPPIRSLISTTPALSLLYECINSVISGEMLDGPEGDALAEACVDKLAAFLEDEDRNLRYISLLALARIVPTHPHLVSRYQEAIMSSIDDQDLSIRLRALDLASGMASRRNLEAIVTRLLRQLIPKSERQDDHSDSGNTTATEHLKRALAGLNLPPEGKGALAIARANASVPHSALSSRGYRLEVARRILQMGQEETFANIDDFEWYLDVLCRLIRLPDAETAARVRDQIVEITARVRAARPFAVSHMTRLLEAADSSLQTREQDDAVLQAAAWVCGEYWEEVANPRTTAPLLLQCAGSRSSPRTASMCLHNSVKLVAHWVASISSEWDGTRLGEAKNVVALVSERLVTFVDYPDCEVSERATEFLQLFEFLQRDLETYKEPPTRPLTAKGPAAGAALPEDEAAAKWGDNADDDRPRTVQSASPKSLHLLAPLFFPGPLGPVGKLAQQRVSPPKALDLSAPIRPLAFTILPPRCERVEDTVDDESGTVRKGRKEASGSGRPKTKKIKGKSRSEARDGDEDDESAARAAARARKKERAKASPFYLDGSDEEGVPASSRGKKNKTFQSASAADDDDDDDLDDVPIVQLTLADLPADFAATASSSREATKSKSKTKSKDKASTRERRAWVQEQEEFPDTADGDGAPLLVNGDALKSTSAMAEGQTQGQRTEQDAPATIVPTSTKQVKKKKRPKAAGIVLD
ncbi:unnamed protein product [Parajaminaea phylloscopi]